MRKTLIVIAFTGVGLAGQSSDAARPEKTAGTGAVADKLRFEIVRMQRDLLLADVKIRDAVERYNAAKSEAGSLQRMLAEKVAEAGKACGEGKVFDPAGLTCVERGAPAPHESDKPD